MTENVDYAVFGSGILLAKVAGGGAVAFGALQDVSLEINAKTEALRGQFQFPLEQARSEMDASLKAKFGYISGAIYASLYFGATPIAGTVKMAYNETGAIPAATPFTIVVANATNFVDDYGVTYASSGDPLEWVDENPAQGQYSVDLATGTYTFAAADEGVSVQITYTYKSSTAGSTIAVPNNLQGVQPVFGLLLQRSYNGEGERIFLPNCIAGKLTLPTSMGKFAISELDLSAFAPNGTSPFTIYTDQ